MKPLLFIASATLLATAAAAQNAPSSAHNPAIKDSAPATTSTPAPGANSFTQDQAKGRLEKAGFTGVSELAKDEHGVWRGTATKAGKKLKVGVDYKGNVIKG
jgi:hypothetical protein